MVVKFVNCLWSQKGLGLEFPHYLNLSKPPDLSGFNLAISQMLTLTTASSFKGDEKNIGNNVPYLWDGKSEADYD